MEHIKAVVMSLTLEKNRNFPQQAPNHRINFNNLLSILQLCNNKGEAKIFGKYGFKIIN